MASSPVLARSIFTVLPLAALWLPARGDTFVWDANTSTTGAQDGAGTWEVGAGNWFDQTSAAQNQLGRARNDTVFGAGSGPASFVALGGPVTANSLTFNATGSGNYTIMGNN